MLLALLLDLGGTLVQGDHVLPHVSRALDELAQLRDSRGMPLSLALVSDYTMLPDGAPDSAVKGLFDEYVERLRGYGLLAAFEPVQQRVTLSTQARVRKPNARIFELALERLGLPPRLSSAMFITESAEHVAAARALGITAWQFGVDFVDWDEAPALVARALANDNAALEAGGGRSAESRHRQHLEETGALAEHEPLGPGQTHALEPGPDGRPRVVRKRFSLR